MLNLTVGLHQCAITKQVDLCVQVFLGHINTEDQGPIEVWANLSEVALRSLHCDLLYPDNRSHGCVIGPGECCVTGRDVICIRALVAVIPEIVDGQLTGREALINACLSQEGVDLLLEHLKQEAAPLNFVPVVEAKSETPYMWEAEYYDGPSDTQFDWYAIDPNCQRVDDGFVQALSLACTVDPATERTFAVVRLGDLWRLRVRPKQALSKLPWYYLCVDDGFAQVVQNRVTRLPLPVPDKPFAFVYYRRCTVTFFCEQGAGQPMAPRIVQVLGWRVGDPDNGLVCELGVEEDGSHAIYRRGRLLAGGEYVSMLEQEFDEAMAERIG